MYSYFTNVVFFMPTSGFLFWIYGALYIKLLVLVLLQACQKHIQPNGSSPKHIPTYLLILFVPSGT